MVTIVNLKLPASWTTTLPNDPNFDISADKLGDFLEAFDPIDWGGLSFVNVANINGQPPGGGGGGLYPDEVPFDRYVYFDDFFYFNSAGFGNSWDGFGAGAFANLEAPFAPETGGVWTYEGIIGGGGEVGGMCLISDPTADGIWAVNPAKDTESKIRVGIGFTGQDAMSGRIDHVGFADDKFIDGTDVSTVMTNINDAALFRSVNGGNWFAVTRLSGTETTTDTGVAAVQGQLENFEINFESGKVTFRINGVDEAEHTTNLPSNHLFAIQATNSVDGAQKVFRFDAWYFIGDR